MPERIQPRKRALARTRFLHEVFRRVPKIPNDWHVPNKKNSKQEAGETFGDIGRI